jgi:PAS domain S-box-containing protein
LGLGIRRAVAGASAVAEVSASSVASDDLAPDAWSAGSPSSAQPASGQFGSGQFGSEQWDILVRIARGASLSEILLGIVDLVEHQAKGMRVSISIFDPATNQLRHGAARRLAPEICKIIDGVHVGPHEGSCGAAAHRRERVVVTDIATHPAWTRYKDRFVERGVRACSSTPILTPAGELLGTLAMHFEQPRGPSADECAWVDAATYLAAIALSRARAGLENDRLDALGKRVKELTLLHKSARLLGSSKDPIASQLETLVRMIPSGWRRPESCRARITWGSFVVSTPGFVDSPCKQTALACAGDHSVSVEIVYLNESAAPEGAFQPEEQRLLESLADLLGAHLEKHHAELTVEATLKELKDKNQKLEFHVSRMPLGYVVWDRQLTVTAWNRAAEHIFGYTAADVVGKRSSELAIFTEAELACDPLGKELSASLTFGASGTHEHVHKTGSRLVCEWLHAPLKDAADQVTGYLSMAHDVTERRRAEEERVRLEAQLRQGQRIQALGTLAGGIAHDFNNILTAISGHAHLGLNDIEEERSPADSLLAIQEASARAVELVRRIMMFSRYQRPERKVCSIVPIIDEALELLRSGLPSGVCIDCKHTASPTVNADPGQIHQLIMNLGKNAVHAIGESGEIQVLVDSIERDHPELAGSADERFERYVRITLSDTGAGMDEATLERIFEPFFSTKPSGQGTGLGLSVVHGIVKGHEGTIVAESKPGRGSVFRIYLPEAREPSAQAAPSPTKLPKASGRVMYVDDEEPLVVLAVRWLSRLGYEVTGFSDSTRALEAFRERPFDFDVVISDFSMPGLSGLALVKEIVALRNDIVVVMSSGFLEPKDQERAKQLGAIDVVLKPQSMAEFGRILHGILSQPRATPAIR